MKRSTGSNIIRVKAHNRQAILRQLLQGPKSRVELAESLDLTAMTVSNLVNELMADGWVIEAETAVSTKSVGRPRKAVMLNPNAGCAIGVHIGIGTLRSGLVNLKGDLLQCAEHSFDPAASATAVLNQINTQITHLTQAIPPKATLFGVGVGASGLIDAENGRCHYAPSLNWHNVPIAKQLQQKVDLPIYVENNVRVMALGEATFARQEVASLVFVYGRVGVGAGIITNQSLFRGTQAGAGEIGHTLIQPDSGTVCRCGQTGCLETLVTQPVLESELFGLKIDPTLPDANRFEQVLQLAKEGNQQVMDALQKSGRYLSIALINLVNTLNPECIILGGMYAQGADIYLPILRQQVKAHAFGGLGDGVKIEASQFGLNAGMIGAASLVLLKKFYRKE